MKMTKLNFSAKATSVIAKLGSTDIMVGKKEFSTGSVGWYSSGKMIMVVDGEELPCNVNVTITVIGSKEAK